VATLTHPDVCLPALVGTRASLNVIFGAVAASGGGKSTSEGCADDLLPIDGWPKVRSLPPGSGEGMVDAFFTLDKNPDDGREKIMVRAYDSVMFSMDEGQSLGLLSERAGQTTMPTIRSMWSGKQVGGAFKTSRGAQLQSHSYRAVFVLSIQPDYVSNLLDDAAGGTPQRFVWFSAHDPELEDTMPGWPGGLGWQPPVNAGELDLAPTIATEIRAARVVAGRGEGNPNPLDAHRNQNRLKIAGLLALFDDRANVTVDDWHLADMVMHTSDRVRGTVIDHAHHKRQQDEAAKIARSIGRRNAIADSDEQRLNAKVDKCAVTIARAIHKHGEQSRRDARKRLVSQDRQHFEQAIERALDREWIATSKNNLVPGQYEPKEAS
jgi:hypothetical protein